MFASRLGFAKFSKVFGKKSIKLLNSQSFTSTQVNNESFKDGKDNDALNVPLFSIKKTLKLANVPFEDSFTNLKTSCPVCESSEKCDVYINKTTGELSHRIKLQTNKITFFQFKVTSYVHRVDMAASLVSSRNSSTHHEIQSHKLNSRFTRSCLYHPKNRTKKRTISTFKITRKISSE